MAKITFPTNIAEGYGGGVDLEINTTKTKATLTFGDGGEIRFFGEGLKGTAEQSLKAGTVDKVMFINGEGDKAIIAVGHYKAVNIVSEANAESIFFSLQNGNDIITGSGKDDELLFGMRGNDEISGKGGSDEINGGRGNDILTGGAAADSFEFSAEDGVGHDIITDFHTIGESADVLGLLDLAVEKITKSGGGDDTKLTLDNGATILLEGVTKAEFLDYWVH